LEAKKDRGMGFSVYCLHGKWGESQNKERGGWERGRKEMLAFSSFLPSPPLPPLLLTPFFVL